MIALLYGWIAIDTVLSVWTESDVARTSASYRPTVFRYLFATNAALLLATVGMMLRRRAVAWRLWLITTIIAVVLVLAQSATHAPYRDALLTLNGALAVSTSLIYDLLVILYLRRLAQELVLV